MMKLRLDLDFLHLAEIFWISPQDASLIDSEHAYTVLTSVSQHYGYSRWN